MTEKQHGNDSGHLRTLKDNFPPAVIGIQDAISQQQAGLCIPSKVLLIIYHTPQESYPIPLWSRSANPKALPKATGINAYTTCQSLPLASFPNFLSTLPFYTPSNSSSHDHICLQAVSAPYQPSQPRLSPSRHQPIIPAHDYL